MIYPLVIAVTVPFSMFLIKDIKGLNNIPKKGAFIVAANHESYLDPILIPSIFDKYFKRKVHFLAKKELFEGIVGNIFESATGGILLDREKRGKTGLKNALNALKEGKIIGIFPEGTRSLTGKIQSGKTGVARLALWARVSVVPIGINGTFELMPKGRIIPKLKKNVSFKIGKPLHFNKYYKRKTTKKLLREITNKIMEEIARLSKQKNSF